MAGAPVIEGSLKNTIHALAFGLIVTTLAVNFGKLFLPHFFPYMMGVVIFVEAVLFSLDKPKEIYEKYQPAGLKGKHTIEGAGAPQITVSAPAGYEEADGTPKKRDKIKDKKTKKDQKGRRESGVPSSPSRQSPRRSLSVPANTGMEAVDEAKGGKETDEKGKEKSEKEKKKKEEKGKKKEKEEEKEKQKAEKKEEKERAKESEEDKSEKGTWRKRLSKKQNSE